ncbi:MAG: response regulator [Planctomycetota bacterium]|jgi:CheY-like chemotaxis protein
MARVLLIDDEVEIRELLSDYLSRIGHEVTMAEDGAIGEALYRANPFDVVVMDIVMPEQGGLETILRLQKDFSDIRIIAISGGSMLPAESYLSLVRPLGLENCLSKPFDLNDLKAAVDRLLDSDQNEPEELAFE